MSRAVYPVFGIRTFPAGYEGVSTIGVIPRIPGKTGGLLPTG